MTKEEFLKKIEEKVSSHFAGYVSDYMETYSSSPEATMKHMMEKNIEVFSDGKVISFSEIFK